MKIIIPAESLLKLKPFVSDEQTRFYLNGVCIQKHPKAGVLLIATDGHRLGVWQETNCSVDGTWPTESLIVGMDNKLSALLKRKGEGIETTYAIVDTEQNTVSIGYAPLSLEDGIPEPDLTQHKALISGTFPDWQKVIPPLGALKAFPFNDTNAFRAEYIGDFKSVNKDSAIGLFADKENDGTGPAVVLIGGTPQFLGVLMPMRSSIETTALHYRIGRSEKA